MAAPTIFSAFLVACQITYGWQPLASSEPHSHELARQGSDVQYIVQVAPDSLRTLEKVGEITSTIDPRVRSRVGRIVIRIGDGPVPRHVPPRSLAHDPSPTADLRDTASVDPPTLASDGEGSGKQVVMKPQAGGGLQLPTLDRSDLNAIGDSVRNGAGQAANGLAAEAKERLRREGNRLTEEMTGAASDGMQSLAEKGRSLMNGNLFSNPANDPVRRATVATGGPSTAEVGRDATYRSVGPGFGIPSTDEVDAARLRNASANPMAADRDRLGSSFPERTATAPSLASPQSAGGSLASGNTLRYPSGNGTSGRGSLQPNGLSTSESFGRSPLSGSANLAATNDPRNAFPTAARGNANSGVMDPALTSTNLTEAERLAGGVLRYGDRIYDRNKQIIPREEIVAAARQIDRQNYDRADPRYASTENPRAANDPNTATGRTDRWWEQNAAAGSATATSGSALQMNITDPRLRQTDPRLSGSNVGSQPNDSFLTVGGNSADRADGYGRVNNPAAIGPIDPRGTTAGDARRDVRDLGGAWAGEGGFDSRGSNLRDDRWPSTDPRDDRRVLPNEDTRTTYAAREAQRWEDARRYRDELRMREVADDRAITERRIEDLSRRVENLSPVSPSDERLRSGVTTGRPTSDAALRTATVSHTPQPLFTGLLLVSGIVNFYLFIWLRNIRVRYRDLVSSKRVVEAV